jgi:hypothetical protein
MSVPGSVIPSDLTDAEWALVPSGVWLELKVA